MKSLTLKLENCYGIKKLDKKLDFKGENVIAIYAPNGSMKSSLAQTFQDIADGKESKDRIFPHRVCARHVRDESDVDLPKESILVVRPHEITKSSLRAATLLVNGTLRREYEVIHSEMQDAKAMFLKAMKEQSGSKRDLDKEISLAFTNSNNQFYIALTRIRDEVVNRPDALLKDVPYDLIFDDKVHEFLEKKDVKKAISGYIKKYNELIKASTYFKKGIFNYYNATQIAKQLAENGFFKAKHSVVLNAGEKKVIATQKELEDLIANEKKAISNDPELRKKFSEIEKLIQKNITLRGLEEFLLNHEELLTKLYNIAVFKEEVWKAYIDARFDLYSALLEKYQAMETRSRQIREQAARERTQWEEVIDIFNSRFVVPFKLQADNRVDVILGQEDALSLSFIFRDGHDQVPVDRTSLMQTLSTGEQRAFYVLNILFEIEVRKKAAQDTLIVVDDIADSFDYKNKYAIIQYLMDISKCSHFRQLILTHNFDFYRTIQSRFVKRKNCYMVSKTDAGIVLEVAFGIKNVFINEWKNKFHLDPKIKIASISFMRNLIEYTLGEGCDFVKLTSLLHWKADSQMITVSDIDGIYNRLFSANRTSPDGPKPVVELIIEEADKCLDASDGINFANKIVLAIATRLVAEQFMVAKINDVAFVEGITSNQTQLLLDKYKELHPADKGTLDVLQRVALMTPENIHLNSFMYEPILDMSDYHLRSLYREVKSLQAGEGDQT